MSGYLNGGYLHGGWVFHHIVRGGRLCVCVGGGVFNKIVLCEGDVCVW